MHAFFGRSLARPICSVHRGGKYLLITTTPSLSAIMATELLITAYIIDLGGPPFSITIEGSKTIDHLKEAILNSKPNDLKGVDPNHLTLYKTEVPDDENIGQSAKDAPKEELKPSRKLSEVFPIQPPEETVSVFVKATRIGLLTILSALAYVHGRRSPSRLQFSHIL